MSERVAGQVIGAPERIYLCYGDSCEVDFPVRHDECAEVTWCDHAPCDVVEGYVRADALDASRAECARLLDLLRQAQWAGYLDGGPVEDGGEWCPDCCPWCGGHRIETGHTAGCPCAAALGDDQ